MADSSQFQLGKMLAKIGVVRPLMDFEIQNCQVISLDDLVLVESPETDRMLTVTKRLDNELGNSDFADAQLPDNQEIAQK